MLYIPQASKQANRQAGKQAKATTTTTTTRQDRICGILFIGV